MLGEHSQIASLKAQLAEAKYNLEQTIVRAPSDGYVTRVLIRPGTYAASLPLRPVMVFIPDQKRQIVAQFRQNSLLRLAPATMRKWCLMLCQVRYSAVSWQPLVQPFPAELISRPAPYRR